MSYNMKDIIDPHLIYSTDKSSICPDCSKSTSSWHTFSASSEYSQLRNSSNTGRCEPEKILV